MNTSLEASSPLEDIGRLVHDTTAGKAGEILERRMRVLNEDIATLRRQQRRILALLKQLNLRKGAEMITKKQWVEIMRAAGLGDTEMKNWHAQFEKMEPVAHGEFLASLDLPEYEITRIRECSRTGNRNH